MRLTKTLRAIVRAATLGATAVLISGAAHAATAGGGMPWEGPLTAVLDRGMLSFANTGRASVFERPGDEQVLRLVHRLARRWPVMKA